MKPYWLLIASLACPAFAQTKTADLAAGLALPGPKTPATSRMTEKTLERYGRLYQRWSEDESIPHLGERDARPYLGTFGTRDALAVGDVLATALKSEGLIELFRAVDAVQSGSALDVLGFETDQFFHDRLGARGVLASQPGWTAQPRHDPKLRLRVRGVERLVVGKNDVRLGVTFSDQVGEGPLQGWHADAGIEVGAKKGGELRGYVGASRPWPEPRR